MTQILPTRKNLQFAEAMIHYRRFQPVVQLEHDNAIYPLSANWSDTVHVFEHRQRLYVLTVNLKLAMVRLDIFAGNSSQTLDSLALTERDAIEAVLGPKWQKLAPKSMVVLLANHSAGKGGAA